MTQLTAHEIAAVNGSIKIMEKLAAATLTPSRERGDLTVTVDLLRELLAEAEEHG